MRDLGTFERHGDYIDVRFERHYPRPAATVWSALTEPERLADWMGRSLVEPFVGGRFETMLDGIQPMKGKVLVWDPPMTLELHWSNGHAPDSTVRYELSPEADGTRLVFTHRKMPYITSALMLPGCDTFFAQLGRMLDEVEPIDWVARWRQLQAVYIEHYALGDSHRDPEITL
jgi:uncharacterized protein YndB with AHSA1/START domain